MFYLYTRKRNRGAIIQYHLNKKVVGNLTEKENYIILYMQPQLRRGKNRHMQSGQVKRKGGGKLYCAK